MDEDIRRAVDRAAAALKEFGAKEVYVFGSAATGTLREHSDIDLAVSGLPAEVYFRAMGRAREALGRPLDLIDLDQENLFTAYLKRKGKLQRVA